MIVIVMLNVHCSPYNDDNDSDNDAKCSPWKQEGDGNNQDGRGGRVEGDAGEFVCIFLFVFVFVHMAKTTIMWSQEENIKRSKNQTCENLVRRSPSDDNWLSYKEQIRHSVFVI